MIDQDISASQRDRLKEYVVNKYGKDYTASIGTYGYFFPRSAARDVARVLGKDQEFINKFAGLIPDNFRGIAPTVEECEKEAPQLLTDPEYKPLWEKVKRIIGLPRNAGSHAAGVLIATDEPIANNIPLYRRSDSSSMITEFDMKEIEELGYVKFDFLGLKNLDVIDQTLKYIKVRHGKDINLDEIDHEDKSVFDLLCNGKVCGIFQFDGSLRSILLRVQPSSIEDLSAISALGRPGPLDAGLVERYIENKHSGRLDTGYAPAIDKIIRPILMRSYGVFAYQEQVMKIAQDIAGFSLSEADSLRKAIGKKSREAMAKLEAQFKDGARAKDLPSEDIDKLWKDIVGFADYCLAASTEVITIEYGPLAIGFIVHNKIQCSVLSVDQFGHIYQQPICQWHNKGIKDVFRYHLDDGSFIDCTEDHKFLTVQGMQSIDKIFSSELDIISLGDIKTYAITFTSESVYCPL